MKFFSNIRLSENISKTPEGYLVCANVPIARVGDMIYAKSELPGLEADAQGVIIVTREADEVFAPRTMTSFEGKSLTLWHPKELVAPRNWSAVTKGILTNLRRGKGANEGDLLGDILVTDERAIQLVSDGLREVSCGYECDYVQVTPGRAVQKNIVGNHLAMVDEGRAGSAYAIMDHKGEGLKMSLGDKIKAVFGKAQEDALAIAAEADKSTKVKTEDASAATLESVMKALKTLDEKVDEMKTPAKGKDELSKPAQSQPAVAKDEEVATSLEDRLKRLEDLVEKMVQASTTDADVPDTVTDEDPAVEVEDAESEEDPKETEDEAEYAEKTTDEKSRIEILAPGTKVSGKDAKTKALKLAYATKDGKAAIHHFTNGKAPNFKDDKFVNMVFIGASEVLKQTRSESLGTTKTWDAATSSLAPKGAVSAAELNKKNEEFYKKR